MDDFEREVRAMLWGKAAGMPDEYNADDALVSRVTRRRTTKMIGAGAAAALVVIVGVATLANATGGRRRSAPIAVNPSTTMPFTTTSTSLAVPSARVTGPSTLGPGGVSGIGCALTSASGAAAIPAPIVPSRLLAGIDAATARQLSSYSAAVRNSGAMDTALAPAGWGCHAYAYTTGGVKMYVFPRSASASFGSRHDAFAASEKYAGPVVQLTTDGFGHGSGVELACTVFAQETLIAAGSPTSCRLPAGRTVTKAGPGTYSFVDRDGTRGIAVAQMTSAAPIDGTFTILTCRLGDRASLCDAIIADFAQRNAGVIPATAIVAALGCDTHQAISSQPFIAAPRVAPVRPIRAMSAAQLAGLSSYSAGSDDRFTVLGPARWSCGYFVGGNGSGYFEVYPPSANAAKLGPYTGASAGTATYNGPEVSIYEDFYMHGIDLDQSCETFAGLDVVRQNFARAYPNQVNLCTVKAGRQVTMQGKYAATFVDADGTHGAAVIALNSPNPGGRMGLVATLTCKTGDALSQSMCDTIITEFLGRNRPDAEQISARNRPGA